MPSPTVVSGRSPGGWAGMLAIGSGLVVYDGPGSSAALHRHDAIQLVWSSSGPFRLRVDEHDIEALAAIVPSRKEHSFDAAGDQLIIMLVEPTGALGGALAEFAVGLTGIDISDRVSDPGRRSSRDPDSLIGWSREALERMAGVAGPSVDSGVRPEVLGAVQYITEHLDGVPRLSEAARLVALSPRQLSRSFTAEIGMPFRRYVVWSRLRRAVVAVRDGNDLTTASATAGFADSAHFSRVFRAMFGLSPSDVLPLLEIAETGIPNSL